MILFYSHNSPFTLSRKLGTLTLLIGILSGIWGQAQAPSWDHVQEKADSLLHTTAFEGSLLIARDGLPFYLATRGYSDPLRKNPLSTNPLFPVASITKWVTAIAILQYAEAGSLDLHQPINTLMADYDLPWEVTPHELLLHISGLAQEPESAYEVAWSMEDYLKNSLSAAQDPARRGDFRYNNVDYVLLGALLEQLAGKPWEEVLRNNVLEPAGMDQSGFLSEGSPRKLVATFSPVQGVAKPDRPRVWKNYHAAANMYATVLDLLALDQALRRDTLLGEQAKKLLYTAYPEYNYSGYGVWTYPYPFRKDQALLMERRGGILGLNATVVRFLNRNVTLIILCNNGQFNPDTFGDPDNLKEALIRIIPLE